MADALDELYTTDVCAETLQIDGRDIPGSLTFELSTIDLVAAGWNENVTAVFSTLKKYFPTGKWPQPLRSSATPSVNGVVQRLQVKQLQGNNDSRAQLLVGLGSFGTNK
jgi:hypothetical protein